MPVKPMPPVLRSPGDEAFALAYRLRRPLCRARGTELLRRPLLGQPRSQPGQARQRHELLSGMRLEDEVSARSAFLATRPISRDNLVPEDPALGLVAFSSPFDPEPSLRIEEGRVVELDGKAEADFDLIDEFVARRGIDLAVAEEAMAVATVDFALMIVDPSVPRSEVTR